MQVTSGFCFKEHFFHALVPPTPQSVEAASLWS